MCVCIPTRPPNTHNWNKNFPNWNKNFPNNTYPRYMWIVHFCWWYHSPLIWFMTYWLVAAHFGNTVCSIGFLTQCQKMPKNAWSANKNRFIFFTTVFVNYSFLCSLNKKNPCKMLDKTNNYQEYVKPSLLFQGNHSLLSVYRFHFIQTT